MADITKIIYNNMILFDNTDIKYSNRILSDNVSASGVIKPYPFYEKTAQENILASGIIKPYPFYEEIISEDINPSGIHKETKNNPSSPPVEVISFETNISETAGIDHKQSFDIIDFSVDSSGDIEKEAELVANVGIRDEVFYKVDLISSLFQQNDLCLFLSL